MALTYEYKVPDKYGGKTLKQLGDEAISNTGSGIGRPDILEDFFGLGRNQVLNAGQTLTYNQPGENLADIKNSAEYKGITSLFGPGQAPGTIQTNDFNQQQRGILDDYLGRLGGVPAELEAVYNALGIPQAYQERDIIGQTIRDLPGAINTGSKGELTSSQIAGRTARDIADITPALQSSQANVQSLVEQYGVKTDQIFKPYDIEAGLLGEQAKNEYDLLKTNISADLDRELAQLSSETQLDLADIQRATKLAEIESNIDNNSYSFVDLGNRIALVNPATGQEIQSFNKGKLSTLGSGNDGW